MGFDRAMEEAPGKLEVYKGEMRTFFVTQTFDPYWIDTFRNSSGGFHRQGLSIARSEGFRKMLTSSISDGGGKVKRNGFEILGKDHPFSAWPFRYMSSWDDESGRLHAHSVIGVPAAPWSKWQSDWKYGSVDILPADTKVTAYVAGYIGKGSAGHFRADNYTASFWRRKSLGFYQAPEGEALDRRSTDRELERIKKYIGGRQDADGTVRIPIGPGGVGKSVIDAIAGFRS